MKQKLTSPLVLVADDEINIRTTIHDILRKYHAHVTVAANGSEAIRLLSQRDFQLVVSDIKMPDKTGYDIFAATRKRLRKLPIDTEQLKSA